MKHYSAPVVEVVKFDASDVAFSIATSGERQYCGEHDITGGDWFGCYCVSTVHDGEHDCEPVCFNYYW